MRHARPAALDQLEELLGRIRRFPQLNERSRGVFYLKARAFLHFHEDANGLYADIRIEGDDFERVKVDVPAEQEALIGKITAALQPRRP